MSDNKAVTITAVADREVAGAVSNMASAILKMASNPDTDVEKMERIFALHKDMLKTQAEIEFNEALNRVQRLMPRIAKNGEIKNKSGKVVARFMKYEDIDSAIRDIYLGEGFSLTHSRKETAGKMVVSTILKRGSHSETTEAVLPYDQANALKSPLQAAVGTFSVGKRVNICSLFNITAEGDDDGGAKDQAYEMSAEQCAEIRNLFTITQTEERRFLDNMFPGIDTVEDIDGKEYDRCINLLEQKRRRMMEGMSA